MTKRTFKISGMHCTSCAINIDGELEDTKGIVEASTNYAKRQTEVEYDEKEISERQIVGIISNAGYKVDPS